MGLFIYTANKNKIDCETQYYFCSDCFPYIEDECINPHLYGENLAVYLVGELKKRGYVIKDYYPEDCGWEIMISHQEVNLYVRCGNLGEGDNKFTFAIFPNTSHIRRWFRKIDVSTGVRQLSKDLYDILNAHQGIGDLYGSCDKNF